jgi:hypothetical protein
MPQTTIVFALVCWLQVCPTQQSSMHIEWRSQLVLVHLQLLSLLLNWRMHEQEWLSMLFPTRRGTFKRAIMETMIRQDDKLNMLV